jgi:hypothetical protein
MEYPFAEKSVRFGDLTVTVRAQWHRWPNSEPPGGTTEISVTLMRDGMDARIVKTVPFRKTDWPLRGLEHEIPRYAKAEAERAVNVFLHWLGLAMTGDMWGLFMELDDFYRFRPIEGLREPTVLDFLSGLRDAGRIAEPLFVAFTHLLCAIHVFCLQNNPEIDVTTMRVRLGEWLLAFAQEREKRFADFTPKEVNANA